MAAATDELEPDFNKGKGKTLAGMILIAAVAIGAFVFYLLNEQPNPYGELGKQVNGLRGRHFDKYMVCALPGSKLSDIKGAPDLIDGLTKRSAGGTESYGTHLRQECAPLLADLGPGLRALMPPEEAKATLDGMAKAVDDLRDSSTALSDHLASLDGAFKAEAAADTIEDVARAWYDFRKAHASLNKQVRKALGRE